MFSQSFTVRPSDDYPFFLTAKRYWTEQCDQDGITLFMLHSTGFHKECWEPTIEQIFKSSAALAVSRIRDAWTLECPNHGEAGVMNETVLRRAEFYCNFTCEKYALAARHFLASKVHGVDFRRRSITGLGHSLGGVAMTILQAICPEYHWKSIVLLDPMITMNPSPTELDLPQLRSALVRRAYERRDVWPDLASAEQYFATKSRMRTWDPRVRALFIKHALRPHPGSSTCVPYDGLSLACTRDEEAAMYRDTDNRSVEDLNRACQNYDVHLILAGRRDFLPKSSHDAIIGTRRFASITVLQDVGHLMIQEKPDIVGRLIFDIIIGKVAGAKL